MSLKKPKNCVYPDCERCVYYDCRYDGLERMDIIKQDAFDKELEVVEPEVIQRRKNQKIYNSTEKGKIKQKKYNSSEKGKMRQKKYNDSEKGKENRKRYALSEKGKESEKRKQKSKIDKGKNAEYCRRYYYKKKLEMQNA